MYNDKITFAIKFHERCHSSFLYYKTKGEDVSKARKLFRYFKQIQILSSCLSKNVQHEIDGFGIIASDKLIQFVFEEENKGERDEVGG